MARAAVKTGGLANVYVGVNRALGMSKYTISGESAGMIDANEFGYPINNKIWDGTIDPGTISIPDVLKDPDDATGQGLLTLGASFGPDEIKFMRDATSYYTPGTGGTVTVTKANSGGGDRNGTEKTSYEFQIAGALLQLRPALVSIDVTPDTPSKAVGVTQQLVATGTYSSGPTKVLTTLVTWASASQDKVLITSGGLAVGIAEGTSVISATLLGITGTETMTVTA